MKPIACVTGATSGIGEATAQLLSRNGYRLILCGRRLKRLEELKKELSSSTEVTILNFDVVDRKAVFAAFQSLPDNWQEIAVLINNAGNAHGLAAIQDGSIDDWEAMIDINVKGLLYVSKAILPVMIKRNSGHVINIGSIAGKEVYPGGNVYCASKFAVDAINQAMRIDLNAYNIRVAAVNPGLVDTEFSMVRFKGDEAKSAKVYQGMNPLVAEDIAEIILFMLTRPAHVNIADLLVLPSAQASATMVNRGN